VQGNHNRCYISKPCPGPTSIEAKIDKINSRNRAAKQMNACGVSSVTRKLATNESSSITTGQVALMD